MIFRPTMPSKGAAFRPLRPQAATMLTLLLLWCQRFGQFWLRNDDLRTCRNCDHVTPHPLEDLEESAPHGDVTEGVTPQVPLSDPELLHPREPPDPTESGECWYIDLPLRPCTENASNHVTPHPPDDLEEPAPHGDVTEGATLRAPHSDPEPKQPRKPPDPTESKPNFPHKVPVRIMIERSDMFGLDNVDQTSLRDDTKPHWSGPNCRHRVPSMHVLDTNEQISRGDDTEGVILKVPCSDPELQLPRVPPDGLILWAQGHN